MLYNAAPSPPEISGDNNSLYLLPLSSISRESKALDSRLTLSQPSMISQNGTVDTRHQRLDTSFQPPYSSPPPPQVGSDREVPPFIIHFPLFKEGDSPLLSPLALSYRGRRGIFTDFYPPPFFVFRRGELHVSDWLDLARKEGIKQLSAPSFESLFSRYTR